MIKGGDKRVQVAQWVEREGAMDGQFAIKTERRELAKPDERDKRDKSGKGK